MRGRATLRRPKIELDTKYHDPLVTKFINRVMLDGKKETAQTIVYGALERLAKEQNKPVPALFNEIIEKAAPILEVRSRRVGGANYQVPVEVRPARKVILVLRWIVETARNKKGVPMSKALYDEMKAVLEGTGTVMKIREDMHKMAESNRAFAHFARY
jgi:small subunit ribosomal protein S7